MARAGKNRVEIERQYMSLSELSHYSGVCIRSLRDCLKSPNNPLPHFRIGSTGRLIRVRRDDFDLWMESQRFDDGVVDRICDEVLGRKKNLKTLKTGKAPEKRPGFSAARRVNPE